MGGPHIEALRISPNYTSRDWERLSCASEADWHSAAAIVKDRLHGRFIRYADDAILSEFSGFIVLAVDSLVMETLQQFREGYIKEWGDSERMIKECLKGHRFQPAFDALARKRYYKDIRCGLLHQAEAKRMWLVRRGEPAILQRWPDKKGYTIDVKLFHQAVNDSLSDYLDDVVRPEKNDLRDNLWKKMGNICSVRRLRGAEYAAD